MGENWQIMSYSPKFSSPIFTDRLKMYLAYALTIAYLPKFSSPIAFTCTVRQNFPGQIFPMYGTYFNYISSHVYFISLFMQLIKIKQPMYMIDRKSCKDL